MKLKHLLLIFSAFFALFSCKNQEQPAIKIIPMPKSIEKVQGVFEFDKSTTFVSDEDTKEIALFFAHKMEVPMKFKMNWTSKVPSKNFIHLKVDKEVIKEVEGYQLNITADKIEVIAASKKGLFYGLQSLLQLLPAEIENVTATTKINWIVPCVKITDAPRFPYRGLHLDVCRHFVPVANIKKHLDMMAMLKLNKFHWHLTEDQGWRIEIKAFPKLTSIGSKRIEGDGSIHEGFYTQEEVKDIVKYASERMIEVIPEIELPGHALAALTAYPEYSCTGGPFKVRNIWGVEEDVYCPSEETFKFLNKVIDEVVTLFPSEYFHIGGDECPKKRWEESKLCQDLMKKEGLKNEHELQSYFVQRVEKMLLKHGKKMIGWDEILEGGLAKTATVMSWRGEKGGIEAAKQGHDVIMTPGNWCYLDHYQGDFRVEPVGIGGYTTLKESYGYEPVPATLSAEQKKYVLGTQGNVWTEYMYTPDIVEYRVYPRIIALAEVNWSEKDDRNFTDFTKRLDNLHARMDMHKINYHIPMPEGPCNRVAFVDSVKINFQTTRPIKMVFTTDGTEPTVNSTEYKQGLRFTENTTLKIASVVNSGRMSPIRTIKVVKEEYSPAVKVITKNKGLHKVSETEFEGYISVQEDAVYEFATDVEQLYVDGKLLISNEGEVKRFSRHNASIALAKGAHKVKMLYKANEIRGGWPNSWTGMKLSLRKWGDDKFTKLAEKDYAH